MKEEKVGKKPKGMVLVISVGKPTGKKPEREADPDTKKKMDRLSSELSRLTRKPLSTKRAKMLAGAQAANQVRYQQGPLDDPNYIDERIPEDDLSDYNLGEELPRDAAARPRHIAQIPGTLNEMTVEEANQFNAAMANRPDRVLEHLRHMAEVEARRRAEEEADAAYQEPQGETNPNRMALKAILKGEPVNFCTCCSPAEIAWAITKAKKKSKPFHGYNPKRHHKKGGLNAKGRAKFKRETGANLKPPVTTKPSKLKPGSKRAKRRKSFCARMSGSKGPTSKDGKLTPKGAALKRWNC